MSDATIPRAVKTAARRVKAKAKTEAAATEAAVEKAETNLKSAAAQLRSKVESGAVVARDWAAHQPDVIRDQVTERPLIAVGVSAGTAFAAGLVIGVLLASRR